MLTQPTIEKLHALHLSVMAQAFEQQRGSAAHAELASDDLSLPESQSASRSAHPAPRSERRARRRSIAPVGRYRFRRAVLRIVVGADVRRVGRSRRLRPGGGRVSLSHDGARRLWPLARTNWAPRAQAARRS
jgi:hypothetical protein